MTALVFFLEEPSAAEMLKGLLPRVLPEGIPVEYRPFEGKQDLEKRLPRLLRAWRRPNCRFVVIRDQDAGDCQILKRRLVNLCKEGGSPNVLIRIACRELESFYLGDFAAVEKGLELKGIARKQNGRKFRTPDQLRSPSRELERLTKGRYQKILGSRRIGPCLSLEGNRSHSFGVLVSGIRSLLVEEDE
ncbi:MAG: DUF4276 family protein [Desulfococcaceae bacterium]